MRIELLMLIIIVVVGFPGGLIAASFLAQGKRTGPFLQRHQRAIIIATQLTFVLFLALSLETHYPLLGMLCCFVGSLGMWLSFFIKH